MITNQETVQICELLYAHGWHLLNGSTISRKAKTRNVEDEFIKSLDKTDEKTGIRIPAALIYQLDTYYAKKEKQTKLISDKGRNMVYSEQHKDPRGQRIPHENSPGYSHESGVPHCGRSRIRLLHEAWQRRLL